MEIRNANLASFLSERVDDLECDGNVMMRSRKRYNEKFFAGAYIIGCSTFSTPFSYLGVKVGMSPSRRKAWDEIIGKVSNRLSKWKIKTLSVGGRLTLIKSVLTSLPLYHMSLYKAPLGVLRDLESLRRNFFNGCILSNRLIAVFWESFSFCSHRFRFPYISLELYLERASNLVAIGSFPRLYALELIKITRGGVDDEQASTHFELVGSNLYSSMIVGHGFLGFLVSFLFTRLVTFIDDILLPFVGDVTRWVKMVTNTRYETWTFEQKYEISSIY
ncbi:hypothetical protein Tco_0024900 [Tanacetum coccineum]